MESLTKLFPEESEVRIKKIPDHVFKVQKVSLETDAWIVKEFGSGAKLAQLLMTGDPRAIMKFFYKLISYDDKVYLKTFPINKDIDENGNDVSFDMVDKLLALSDGDDAEAIIMALFKARGISVPEIEEGKKKARSKK